MKQKNNSNSVHHSVVLLGVLVLVSNLWSGVAISANDNVHFFGVLISEACVILPGEEEVSLDFGPIQDDFLYKNTRTPSKQFYLSLKECDLSISKAVKVTFKGTENIALPGLLKVSDNDTKGIAIGLETSKGVDVPLNQPISDKYILQSGSTTIVLNAYVQGEPKAIENKTIKRGPFSAVVTFNLEYE